VQIEQHLLDEQATEAVNNENDRVVAKGRPAEKGFEDIDGPILQRHGRPEPVRCRRLVAQRVDRQPCYVLGKP
jgi:hypothetical protein